MSEQNSEIKVSSPLESKDTICMLLQQLLQLLHHLSQ